MRRFVWLFLAVCLLASPAALAAVDPPAEEAKPAEEVKPAEEAQPAAEAKPVEEAKPAADIKPAPVVKPAPAVTAPTPSAGDDFVAMDPSDSEFKEELPGWPFLYSAYAIIWIGLFWYLISLGRRQRRVDAQIAELRAIVQEKVGKA